MNNDNTQEKEQFNPSTIVIFEELDGYHWCKKSSEFLDARGPGYPSRAAAMRAAKLSHENNQKAYTIPEELLIKRTRK